MIRLLFLFALTVLALSIAPARAAEKIDVNLASVSELQKLPGITSELAEKIVAERPYAKPADLHAAGLSALKILQLTPFITFSKIQREKPGPEGGAVAQAPVHNLNEPSASTSRISGITSRGAVSRASVHGSDLCPAGSTSAQPLHVFSSKTKESGEAVCIPLLWFSPDGDQFTETGKTQFSSLGERFHMTSDKPIKIIDFDQDPPTPDGKSAPSTRAEVLASELRRNGDHKIEIVPGDGFKYSAGASKTSTGLSSWGVGAGLGGLTGMSKTKNIDHGDVDTLLLVVPSAKKQNPMDQ